MSIRYLKDSSEGPKLSWMNDRTVESIQGHFYNGELQGIVTIHFSMSQEVFAEVKDGYFHGGMITHGVSTVLPGVRILFMPISHHPDYLHS